MRVIVWNRVRRALTAALAVWVGFFVVAIGSHVPQSGAWSPPWWGSDSGQGVTHQPWHRHFMGPQDRLPGLEFDRCAVCLAQRGSRAVHPAGVLFHPAWTLQCELAFTAVPAAVTQLPPQPPCRAPPPSLG